MADSWTKEQHSAYHKDYYQKRKDYYRDKSRRTVARNRNILNGWKSSHPCTVCGESDIRCLDVHHPDPTTKKRYNFRSTGIAQKLSGYGAETLLKELATCQSLCANCHRKVHGVTPHGDN